MMPLIRSLIGTLSLVLMLTLPSVINAQTAVINTDKDNANPPNVYNLGDTITVTISNIPWRGDDLIGASYSLTVLPKGGDFSGSPVAGVTIETRSVDNIQYSCSTTLWNGEGTTNTAWGSNSCTPDFSTGTPFTFTGTLNTNELKTDPNSTTDMVYSLQFEGSTTCSSCFAIKEFTIKAPKQSTSSFQIRRIDDITNNVLLFEGPSTTHNNEVAQGDRIRIRFMPYLDPSPTYKWGVAGRQENPSGTCAKHAQENRCYVDYTIPNDVEGSVTIHLMNTETGEVASAVIKVKPKDPIPTGVETTVAPTLPPTPTPEPTPTPPHPPCATPTFSEDGRFVGCAGVAFGIDRIISTNPAAFIRDLFSLLLSISGGILLLLIIYSGYQMMTSRGDPERIQAARERITSAIVGFLFLVFSLVVLESIGVDILRIPGFRKEPPPVSRDGINSPNAPRPNEFTPAN